MNKVKGILTEDIVHFFKQHQFVVVATIDEKGMPHTACKDILKIDTKGVIHLLDLYKARTYNNLLRSDKISVTAVDDNAFKGYCLKGRAGIVNSSDLGRSVMTAWEKRMTERVTKRMIRNIQADKGQKHLPETYFPKPEYLIEMRVEEVINLVPAKCPCK